MPLMPCPLQQLLCMQTILALAALQSGGNWVFQTSREDTETHLITWHVVSSDSRSLKVGSGKSPNKTSLLVFLRGVTYLMLNLII